MPHKLLLADDSVTIQRVIELTFADEDVLVIAVGDGKQAIDRVQQEHPDIVLADIGMPERDGYEVASFIKNTPQLAHIPVLLLTGAFEPIDENRARSVGCDGVLVKPFEPQMVINRVRDLLAGRRPAGLWASSPTAQTPVRPPAGSGDSDVRGPAGGAPAAAAGRGNDALEEYFDRLDAAFAGPDKPAAPAPAPAPPAPIPISVSSAPPPSPGFREPPAPGGQPPPPPVNISEWDPHLPGDAPASRPAPIPVAGTKGPDAAGSWNPDLTPSSAASASAPPSPAAPAAAPPSPAGQGQPPAPAVAAVPQMPPLADAFAALLAAEQGTPIDPSSHRIGSLSDDQLDEIARRVIDRMSDQPMRRAVLDAAERLVREEIERIKSKSR